MKKILFMIVAVAAVLSGCNKAQVETTGKTGTLQLAVGCIGDYRDKTPELTAVTKATAEEQELINTFIINIVKNSGSFSITSTVADFMEQNEGGVISLSPGTYTISVTSPGTAKAAWDQPIYSATRDFTILEDVITPIDIQCTLANMKVSVTLSDTFKSELSAYSIIVTGEYADGDASLTWSYTGVEDVTALEQRAGYFAVAPLTVEIQGTRAVDGSEAHKTYIINDVAAADHHILNIDAKVTGSSELTGITIDYTVNQKPVDITVPGFDEIPVPDEEPSTEPGNPTQDPEPSDTTPTLVWAANPEFASWPLAATMDVNLTVNAPETIETFTVSIDSETLAPLLSQMFGGTVLDLGSAQPGSTLASLGLPVGDQVVGQTTVDFPLSTLLPLLYQLEPAPGSEHTFTLTVVDAKGQKLEQPLVFYMPEA